MAAAPLGTNPSSYRFAVLLLGVVAGIQVADPLVASLTLVKASDSLDLTGSLQSLAAGIAVFALAATVIPTGLLADRLGRREVLAGAVLVSAAGQIVTAFGPGAPVFLAGRVVTGVALGAIFASAYAMVKAVAGPSSQDTAVALFSAVATVFPLAIMVMSGPMAALSWRLAYLILPVVSVVVFPLILRTLPRVAAIKGESIDYVGMVLVAVGVTGLLVGISSAATGLESVSFWLPIGIGVVALIGFAIQGNRAVSPLFPPKMFLHPAFLAAVLMGIVFNFINGSTSQLGANFWQYVTHIPTAMIGIATLPVAVFSVAAALATGRLMKARVPLWLLTTVGGGLGVLALLSLTLMRPVSSYLEFLPMMAFAGLSGAALTVIQGSIFLSLAPAKFFGPVTSARTAVGQFGYSLGLSGTTVLVSVFTMNGVARVTNGAVTGETNWDAVTSYMATGSTTDPALLRTGQAALEQAYAHAFNLTTLISAVTLAVLVAISVWALRHRKAAMPMEEFLEPILTVTPTKEV